MYIPSFTRMDYQEREKLVKTMRNRCAFNTRAISGIARNGDTTLNGVMSAHAEGYTLCPKCGQDTCYDVYSYRELFYSSCNNPSCLYEYMYVETWEINGSGHLDRVNSTISSKLQDILSEAFPSFRAKREEYLQNVKKARKWFTPDRRQLYKIEDKLTDKQVLDLYNKYKTMVDKLLAF